MDKATEDGRDEKNRCQHSSAIRFDSVRFFELTSGHAGFAGAFRLCRSAGTTTADQFFRFEEITVLSLV